MSGKEVLLLLFLYRLIVSLHVGNLLLQLAHLLFLQYLFVFDRYYLDELVDVVCPVVEHDACQLRTGVQIMLPDEFVQLFSVRCFFD